MFPGGSVQERYSAGVIGIPDAEIHLQSQPAREETAGDIFNKGPALANNKSTRVTLFPPVVFKFLARPTWRSPALSNGRPRLARIARAGRAIKYVRENSRTNCNYAESLNSARQG